MNSFRWRHPLVFVMASLALPSCSAQNAEMSNAAFVPPRDPKPPPPPDSAKPPEDPPPPPPQPDPKPSKQ